MERSVDTEALRDRVALVAGATRGAGIPILVNRLDTTQVRRLAGVGTQPG